MRVETVGRAQASMKFARASRECNRRASASRSASPVSRRCSLRRIIALEHRKQIVADAIAEDRPRQITAVDDVRLTNEVEIGEDLVAAQRQHRTHDASRARPTPSRRGRRRRYRASNRIITVSAWSSA